MAHSIHILLVKCSFKFYCCFHHSVDSVQLVAYVSQHGLHGEFHFIQHNDNSIEIETKLETTLQYPDQIWSWSIHEMPTDYNEVNSGRRCHPARFGNRLIEFDNDLGYLQLPGNETTKWQISSNLTSKFSDLVFI